MKKTIPKLLTLVCLFYRKSLVLRLQGLDGALDDLFVQ